MVQGRAQVAGGRGRGEDAASSAAAPGPSHRSVCSQGEQEREMAASSSPGTPASGANRQCCSPPRPPQDKPRPRRESKLRPGEWASRGPEGRPLHLEKNHVTPPRAQSTGLQSQRSPSSSVFKTSVQSSLLIAGPCPRGGRLRSLRLPSPAGQQEVSCPPPTCHTPTLLLHPNPPPPASLDNEAGASSEGRGAASERKERPITS